MLNDVLYRTIIARTPFAYPVFTTPPASTCFSYEASRAVQTGAQVSLPLMISFRLYSLTNERDQHSGSRRKEQCSSRESVNHKERNKACGEQGPECKYSIYKCLSAFSFISNRIQNQCQVVLYEVSTIYFT